MDLLTSMIIESRICYIWEIPFSVERSAENIETMQLVVHGRRI